jgi:hypothetical protein
MAFIKRYAPLRREHKPKGPTAKRRARKRRSQTIGERVEKTKVRLRDGGCRFPRCGCRSNPNASALKKLLTVSHDFHKGMGGDPNGRVSIAALMIALCKWRHQDGRVSRHAGTMRTRYLTPDQNDGPLAFDVDLAALYPGLYTTTGVWFEVAREHYVEGGSGTLRLERTTSEQDQVLADLAEMER